MKKFSTIRKVYEAEEMALANLPQNIQQVENEIEQMVEPTETTSDNSGTPVSLFSKLFESREMAHIYHLQVNGEQGSHAAHTALGEYYDEVLELLDKTIETYQGQYGIIDGYQTIDTAETRTKEVIAYFEELVEFVKHARKAISAEDTHLQNIIDEVVALIYRTLYKIRFLK